MYKAFELRRRDLVGRGRFFVRTPTHSPPGVKSFRSTPVPPLKQLENAVHDLSRL
jgi:hypothetical protein